ncbi:TetR/AcrR family transcriptional regulator [Streptomyces sp. MP131-18]|uniref:TetR/AcrR family transcriptional regulator n=1 Tax=Streptomyces sp. MP131-18 TaxID=1857892 RepID=UPI00097BF680|nr:TetR/AcrR family transcriptional regulator [Streptomyces sp. MP131-18]ONK11270.1 putative HTH-type transcriptional regulator YxaF [Streptomyces sp. MP131-18]
METTPLRARKRSAAGKPVVDTRERILRAASRLMQRHGYDGTGIKQISQEADATLGSVYHFFPGGKQQLAIEVIHRGAQEFTDELNAVFVAEEDPGCGITLFTRLLAEGLRASDWMDGCPVTTTALGTHGRLPELQAAAAEAFAGWRALVHDKLRATGFTEQDALALSHTVISTVQGAELTAQVSRVGDPLDAAGAHLARLIASYR